MGLVYQNITDLKSWFKVAPPKGKEKQWKCTRSAMELARYITHNINELPDTIKKAIEYTGETCDKDFTWQAEYETPLKGRGEGRNHDMAIFGDNIFIGVEAKADEPFDKTVVEWMNEGSENKTNKLNRINDLCEIAFGENYNSDKHGELRYQLLTAFGGTVKEAEKDKKKALLLVLVFTNDNDYDKDKIINNKNDFDKFACALGMQNQSKTIGSNEIVFAGMKETNGIKAYLVKAVIQIDPKCADCGWQDECKIKQKNKRV